MDPTDAVARPREAGNRTGAGLFVFYAVLTLVLCLGRGAWDLPLTSDNQHYFFIAERAAAGVPPHVSQFDPKHQISGLLGAGAIRVLRPWGLDDVRATRVLSLVATAGAVGLAALAGQWLAGAAAGHIAALVMVGGPGFLFQGSMGCRPKIFLAFFALAAALAVCRRRPALAGVAAACGFLSWQPGIVLLVAAMLSFAVASDTERRGATLRVLAGAALPLLIYHLYFVAHGAFADLWEQAYMFPARYPSGREKIDLLEGVWWLFGFGKSQAGLHVLGYLFVGALALAWGAALCAPTATVRRLRAQPGLIYVCVAGHAALVFTLLEFQGYPDAFFVLPFMALTISVTAVVGSRRLAALLFGGGQRLAAAALVCAAVLATIAHATPPFKVENTLADQYRLAQRVGGFLAQGYSVYAVGCTHLLAMNHVSNHVRYGYFFRRVNRYLTAATRRETGSPFYRPRRDGEMPDMILLSRWFIPGGDSWLAREYYDVTTEEFANQGTKVWVR